MTILNTQTNINKTNFTEANGDSIYLGWSSIFNYDKNIKYGYIYHIVNNMKQNDQINFNLIINSNNSTKIINTIPFTYIELQAATIQAATIQAATIQAPTTSPYNNKYKLLISPNYLNKSVTVTILNTHTNIKQSQFDEINRDTIYIGWSSNFNDSDKKINNGSIYTTINNMKQNDHINFRLQVQSYIDNSIKIKTIYTIPFTYIGLPTTGLSRL
jgi:hypothetical protein